MWCMMIVSRQWSLVAVMKELWSYGRIFFRIQTALLTFDYLSEEDDDFEDPRFEREKSEEERIAKHQLRQNKQPPINTLSNKPTNKPTGGPT